MNTYQVGTNLVFQMLSREWLKKLFTFTFFQICYSHKREFAVQSKKAVYVLISNIINTSNEHPLSGQSMIKGCMFDMVDAVFSY